MKFSLIICTYKRPGPLIRLLDSVKKQDLYPGEILVVDGSPEEDTARKIKASLYPGLRFFRVGEVDRGLTKQRNFGISRVSDGAEIICFLDDDTVLTPEYFKHLLNTYDEFPDAIGVGGYILDEISWRKTTGSSNICDFQYDNWVRKLGSRNELRKKLGLLSKSPPGVMPEFSNGFSTGYLPPSGKTYPVEFFMGGVASYRKKLLSHIQFSEYFEGYGLYEDMEFCLRASTIGQLYVNTEAQLFHYHEHEGRPNQFTYGRMVIRNGWYVWRTKYPDPTWKARIKWHGIAFLLTLVRVGNVFTTSKKREALTESLGRFIGWGSLFLNRPKK